MSTQQALPEPLPSISDDCYRTAVTPRVECEAPFIQANPRVGWALYSSITLVLLQPLQFGWSIYQVNLSMFHDQDDCDARPNAPGTCLMFPGHSANDWALVVNLWVVGGMLGSLCCGRVSDQFGRKRALMANAVIMIIGAVVQASAPSIHVFATGRFVAGIASGSNTVLTNGYINEITPPHLRNSLGALFQVGVSVSVLLVSITFFFADTATGWRFIASVPIVFAVVFLAGAPRYLVESPTWLLNKNRVEGAEHELARLVGQENVALALTWMRDATESMSDQSTVETLEFGSDSDVGLDDKLLAEKSKGPWRQLFSTTYRRQTLLAIMLAVTQQFSGINAIFFYASSVFKDAGLDDDRIGGIVVCILALLPTAFAGSLGSRFGNRGMILFGHAGMFLAAVGITASLVMQSPLLSIVFTGIYVAVFAVSLGPIVFIIIAAVFPTSLRATGTSIGLFANWCGTLVVGISYPHVANALGDWGFVPFIVTLLGFGLLSVSYLPETAGKTDAEIQALFNQSPTRSLPASIMAETFVENVQPLID